jgi:Na+-translocating ferredoxin:NAD+ oxidoreductase RnfD subunit
MISDPKTAPNAPIGRALFALFVATVAFTIQFIFYQPNGPILALILCAPLVPVIDAVLHGSHYRWDRPDARPSTSLKGVHS